MQNLSDEHTSLAADLIAEIHRNSSITAEHRQAFELSFQAVLPFSLYVEQRVSQNPGLLVDLVQSSQLFRAYRESELMQQVTRQLQSVTAEASLVKELRRIRQREMVRIIWRDLAGWSDLNETLHELSELAEACVEQALTLIYKWTCSAFGTPRSESGEAQQLVVLAMGKLGGHELNLSSDIDLIFAYPEEGDTDGRKSLTNHEFFQKLGQRLVNVLSRMTADGFVFRVDLRLRPFGSGPLAMSFDAMESYYETHGREWERYALIKARVIAGDKVQGHGLLSRLKPFVYRRYVDYGAFESLREMKSLIQKEVQRRNKHNNIKLGIGGIREIEFIGQVFQLIHGGREQALQSRSILQVLDTLQQFHLLPDFVVSQLMQAYTFLRRCEHRLQAWRDEQTHLLPDDLAARDRLAWSMGFPDWPAFYAVLAQHRQHVHEHFEQVFVAPQSDAADDEAEPIAQLWQAELDDEEAWQWLQTAGFTDAPAIWQRLTRLRQGRAFRTLSTRGQSRMNRLMPLLLGACRSTESPDLACLRSLEVIEAVMQRSVYLALLIENPLALSQFVRLCAASPWIARYLSQHPLLLDDLLDVNSLFVPPDRHQLGQELTRRMDEVAGDEERSMDALRHFKQSHFLKVAAADIFEALPLMEVSNHLSWIAEAVLEQALKLAWTHLVARHGRPLCRQGGEPCDTGFAVVAYGKLGGLELGYGSDLDLVFLHGSESEDLMTTGKDELGQNPVANGLFFARLGQRLMHILGAMTPAGVLFEADMRLRPDGAAGMLVSSVRAFTGYQQHKAWSWEHQALVRARAVAGDPAIMARFREIRAQILSESRDLSILRQAVCEMREKMHHSLTRTAEGEFDLKHSPGGIVDIEFMVQYGVLAYSHNYPDLMVFSDTIRILAGLARAGVMNEHDATLLTEAYKRYRSRLHRLTLQESSSTVSVHEFTEQFADVCAGVRRIWHSWLEDPVPQSMK